MIQTIEVPIERDRLWMDANVVYAQAPGWCGYVTANLKMTVIYHDDGVNQKRLPCLIWICGGGWKWMNVESYLPNLIDLCNSGYVLVSAEYQCSNDAAFPAQVRQLKEAVRYLRAHAEKYRIDPDRIGVIGESSGGYLASFLGVTCGLREFEEGGNPNQSSAVQAVCSWYTPVKLAELTDLRDLVNRFLDCDIAERPELAKKADPLTYINAGTPPFLLLHGTADTLVPIRCTEALHDALEAHGVPVEYYRIKGANHADYPFFQPTVMKLMVAFFDRYFKNGE